MEPEPAGYHPGLVEANAERARRGVGAAPPVVAPGGAAPPVGAPNAASAPGSDGVPLAPGVVQIPAGSLAWVAAEAVHGKRYGEQIDVVTTALVRHAKTVHAFGDGKTIFCECIGSEDVEEFNNRPSLCDGRVVPRKQNALGSPEITLVEAVSKGVQFEMGWKLTGPRTSKWCLNYLVVEGLGFEAHHERFRQLCRVESTTWGVQEHFQLSMMLRQLIQVDMVNGFNSLGVELMFRRVQTIEYAHSEKARESEARSSGGKLALEEQYMFGSLVRQAGTLMIVRSCCNTWRMKSRRTCNCRRISGKRRKRENWLPRPKERRSRMRTPRQRGGCSGRADWAAGVPGLFDTFSWTIDSSGDFSTVNGWFEAMLRFLVLQSQSEVETWKAVPSAGHGGGLCCSFECDVQWGAGWSSQLCFWRYRFPFSVCDAWSHLQFSLQVGGSDKWALRRRGAPAAPCFWRIWGVPDPGIGQTLWAEPPIITFEWQPCSASGGTFGLERWSCGWIYSLETLSWGCRPQEVAGEWIAAGV